ncbi:hypothetical protein MRB53_024771 [Persea americana]|uniref:Uncharacterized protein n=1 Tax=Persea americana TaxID=3435 RepID=A0ACC2LDP9_PERAE|nr:hypothetical protein MRB53_024771 [Persea americana]
MEDDLSIDSLQQNLITALKIPEGLHAVEIEDELLEAKREQFRYSLAGRSHTDHSFNLGIPKQTLLKAWRCKAQVQVIDLDSDIILFQFQNVLDMKRVLANGPWCYNGHLLVLQQWNDELSASEMSFTYCPFWIQLHDMPFLYMTDAIGRWLGASIGQVEEVDLPDGKILGGQFLRVKVCLDLSRPLLPHVYLQRKSEGLKRTDVRYERLPIFCYHCGLLGHDIKHCDESLSHLPSEPDALGKNPISNMLQLDEPRSLAISPSPQPSFTLKESTSRGTWYPFFSMAGSVPDSPPTLRVQDFMIDPLPYIY